MNRNNFFQSGSSFVDVTFATMCLRNRDAIADIEFKSLKDDIIEHLNTHAKASISELSEIFDCPPSRIVQALKLLEDEGRIRNVD